jgi:hypothetical protein
MVKNNESNEILTALQASGQKISQTRLLENYLLKIEECVAAGYHHADIHAWLLTAGLELKYQSYRQALKRMQSRVRSTVETAGRTPHLAKIVSPSPTPSIVKGPDISPGLAGSNHTQQRKIESKPSGYKPFSHDPTAAGRLDLKNF